MKQGYIIRLAWRYLRHRSFATIISVIAIALSLAIVTGVGLTNFAIKKTAVEGSIRYPLAVGPGSSSSVQVILSTIFHVDKPTGRIPFSVYEDLAKDPRVVKAFPLAVADSLMNYPIIGSTEEFVEDIGVGCMEGKIDFSKPFYTVIGFDVANRMKMAVGTKYYAAHGMTGGHGAHVHKEMEYKVVGVLNPTGGPEDTAIYTGYKGVWLMHKLQLAHGHYHHHHGEGEDDHAEDGHNHEHEDGHHEAEDDDHHDHHDKHAKDDDDHDHHDKHAKDDDDHDHHDKHAKDDDEHDHHDKHAKDDDDHDHHDKHAKDDDDHDHHDKHAKDDDDHDHHDKHAKDDDDHDHHDDAHAKKDHDHHDDGHHDDDDDEDHEEDDYMLLDNELTAVLVRTANPAFTAALEREWTLKHGTQGVDTARAIRSLVGYLNKGERLVEVFGILTLLVAIIMILVTLVMSINERRKELALMRSLGIGQKTIALIIMWEAFCITLMGAVVGLAAGHLLTWWGQAWIKNIAGIGIEPFVMTSMEGLALVLTLIAGQLLALVSMVWTYRMNVIEEIAKE